jgi:hypothetical protein
MKKFRKVAYIGLVLAIAGLMCIQAGAISATTKILNDRIANPTTASFGGDTLISVDNPDNDDIHPQLVLGPGGVMVCAYEKVSGLFSSVISVAWSADAGETWTTQFEFDSIDFTAGTGYLQYPSILYNAPHDVFYLTMVDPYAEMYNNEMAFIPGDIANAEEASWYGISGGGAENYVYCVGGQTENFFMAITTEDGYSMIQTFGMGYFTYPDFESPPGMGGFYYDGCSEHVSWPASELQMDSADRMIVVCQTDIEGEDSQITIKSTVADEDLLTSGEQQNGMDKWSDIEQFPGEYIAYGTDPSVATSGNNVAVVYVAGGDVVCSYSSYSATEYEPGFNWQTSTVASGAVCPSIYMNGNMVQCAYVKDGNVFQITSEDKGATWGSPTQINQVEGFVSSEPGSVDITEIGLVWTDERNGAKDIYTAGAADIPIINVKSISKGMGVSAVIENTGTADATDVAWSITIDASLMILGGETTGTIDVPIGGEVTIKSGFVLGFGPAAITVTAGDASGSDSGTVLLFFIM